MQELNDISEMDKTDLAFEQTERQTRGHEHVAKRGSNWGRASGARSKQRFCSGPRYNELGRSVGRQRDSSVGLKGSKTSTRLG